MTDPFSTIGSYPVKPMSEIVDRLLPRRGQSDPNYVVDLIESVLRTARELGASDVHFIPLPGSISLRFRIDGILQQVCDFPTELGPRIVARLKVLSKLLTYQTEVPQEGRIHQTTSADGIEEEMRVSTFPTVCGEKAVVRLFAGSGEYRRLNDLGFERGTSEKIRGWLQEIGGVLLVCGPAGSGKTTTLYACLRELLDKSGAQRSLVSLEDPVEAIVPGVSQSQAHPVTGFTLSVGLRSLLRQDPEVIMVGEIRDQETAQIVFQAALTGHLVITSFHAGSGVEAISRLSDMEIEPYIIRSGLRGILCQRLVRRLCECRKVGERDEDRLGLNVDPFYLPGECPQCHGTGYRGRSLLVEVLDLEDEKFSRGILSRQPIHLLEQAAREAGYPSRFAVAERLVTEGITSPAEIRRVLGLARHAGGST